MNNTDTLQLAIAKMMPTNKSVGSVEEVKQVCSAKKPIKQFSIHFHYFVLCILPVLSGLGIFAQNF